jgi:hypothetical protein
MLVLMDVTHMAGTEPRTNKPFIPRFVSARLAAATQLLGALIGVGFDGLAPGRENAGTSNNEESMRFSVDAFHDLTQAFGVPATAEKRVQFDAVCPTGRPPKWESLGPAAAALGVRLERVEASVEKWLEIPGPVLAEERASPGWAIYLLRSKHGVQRLSRRSVKMLTWEDAASRYTGRLLRMTAGAPRPSVLNLSEFHARISCRGPGDVVRRVFHIGNAGREPLGLRLVSTSCACSTVTLSSQTIQPGTEGTVRLTIRSQGVGLSDQRLVLATTDPYWPQITLGVELKTPQPISLYPERLFLSNFGQTAEAEASLMAPGHASLLGLATTAAWLEAWTTPERELDELKQWTLHMRVHPPLSAGENRADVIAELSTPEASFARLPVIVRRFGSGKRASGPMPVTKPSRSSLRLLYTTDLRGNLVPCDCTPGQLGGLHRMATLVAELRQAADQEFLLDGGDALDDSRKADVVADIFGQLQYDACNVVGDSIDSAEHVWSTALEERGVRVVRLGTGGSEKVPSMVLGGGRLGLVALSGADDAARTRVLEDAVQACAQLAQKADAVAVLSRLGLLWDVRFARRLAAREQAAVIFGGRQSVNLTEPLRVGPVLLAPVGDRGMYVTKVDFADCGAVGLRPAFAERVPVRPELPPEPKVARRIENYIEAQKLHLAALVADPGDHPGPATCAECHEEAVAAWRQSRHARALLTLKNRDRLIAECVCCHSTPFRATGTLPAAHADLIEYGVICEACHRQGEAHAMDPDRARTTSATSREDCVVCHSPTQQIEEFPYEQALEAIRHWASRP